MNSWYCIVGNLGTRKLWWIYHDMILARKMSGELVLAKEICIGQKHLADFSLVKCCKFTKLALCQTFLKFNLWLHKLCLQWIKDYRGDNSIRNSKWQQRSIVKQAHSANMIIGRTHMTFFLEYFGWLTWYQGSQSS